MYSCRSPKNPRQLGFTLVELMITVAIAAVLTTIALPNLRSFILNNRLSSNVNSFIGLMNYARSEAIARNQAVVVCARTSASDNDCSSNSAWNELETIVFVDANGNGNFNSANDVILKVIPALDVTGNETRFTRQTNTSYIKFQAVGLSQSTHRFDIYAVGNAAHEAQFGRTICISKPGRARVIGLTSGTCNNF